jgi:hypothetical protein
MAENPAQNLAEYERGPLETRKMKAAMMLAPKMPNG